MLLGTPLKVICLDTLARKTLTFELPELCKGLKFSYMNA